MLWCHNCTLQTRFLGKGERPKVPHTVRSISQSQKGRSMKTEGVRREDWQGELLVGQGASCPIETLWNRTVAMAAQHCEYALSRQIVHLKAKKVWLLISLSGGCPGECDCPPGFPLRDLVWPRMWLPVTMAPPVLIFFSVKI